MSIQENISNLKNKLPEEVTLIAVSKTYPPDQILQAYNTGHRDFGENKVQELLPKYESLPKDIRWHLIGHLQSNKVKYIASFVHMIHSVDSLKLLTEINKQAEKHGRVIDCLLQVYIASEESKFGLSEDELFVLLSSEEYLQFKNIRVTGLMGMASNTDNWNLVRSEFSKLKNIYVSLNKVYNNQFTVLSMGMSSDYNIAIEEGSTMIRVGSYIFGKRR